MWIACVTVEVPTSRGYQNWYLTGSEADGWVQDRTDIATKFPTRQAAQRALELTTDWAAGLEHELRPLRQGE
jgi:hypothetical protein